VLRVWRVLQQPPIKRQLIVMLADMPLPRQFESDLLVLNVVESALLISVSAVIYASIKDRNDNTTTCARHRRHRRTTTSKQASKQGIKVNTGVCPLAKNEEHILRIRLLQRSVAGS